MMRHLVNRASLCLGVVCFVMTGVGCVLSRGSEGIFLLATVAFAVVNHFTMPPKPPWNARLCKKCGYDLAGNESGTCPECGTPTSIGGSTLERRDGPQGPDV